MTELKKLREKIKLTQEEVAIKMDVSVNTVQNWESGRNVPKLDVLNRLLKALGVSGANERANIIGRMVISNYNDENELNITEKLPYFLFEDQAEELEKVKLCMASSEELDMLAYVEYVRGMRRYKRFSDDIDIRFPLEFAFFEKYGGYNKTMNKINDVTKRLGSLKSDALKYALENPGCDYRLIAFDKKQIIEKIGILFEKNKDILRGEDDYSQKIEKLYKDLRAIGANGMVYSINGKIKNKEILHNILQIPSIKQVRYSYEEESVERRAQDTGYITIEKHENDLKEYLEVIMLTERGKQLIKWFEED